MSRFIGGRELTEPQSFLDGRVSLFHGDCREVLRGMAENSVDSIVTDPPYHLQSIVKRFAKVGRTDKTWSRSGPHQRTTGGFMNKQWDGGDIAFQPELWAEVLRVMKPGAHGLAMGGTRTYHRLVCAIEDAGAEIRDCYVWAYGSGFPKSLNVSKQIDKMAGAERKVVGKSARHISGKPNQKTAGLCGSSTFSETIGMWMYETSPATAAAREWDGWGTAAKPAVELICMFRKPISEASVAANVLKWGTGALNIAACKIRSSDKTKFPAGIVSDSESVFGNGAGLYANSPRPVDCDPSSRWPANLIHDNSEQVLACFPEENGYNASRYFASFARDTEENIKGAIGPTKRLIYTSKANQDCRLGSHHPCVKPLALIQYLVRLVTPLGGLCLDHFAGSGTTGEAAFREGFRAILIEKELEYIKDIEKRLSLVMSGPDERRRESIKKRGHVETVDNLPLFGGS